jgi:hypothetical protein
VSIIFKPVRNTALSNAKNAWTNVEIAMACILIIIKVGRWTGT